MAWTAPYTWPAGLKVTAAKLNEQVRDNLDYLKTYLDVYACRVTASSTSNVTTATWTLIEFDGETFDTATMHDNSTNNSRITAPVSGVYEVYCYPTWTANATGVRATYVRKNAAGSNSGGTLLAQHNSSPLTSSITGAPLRDLLSLTAGDYIEFFRYQTSGGNLAPADVGTGSPCVATVRLVYPT